MLICISCWWKATKKAGELGFEPRTVALRWQSPRIAVTSRTIETPKTKRKPTFRSHCRHLAFTGAMLPSSPRTTRLSFFGLQPPVGRHGPQLVRRGADSIPLRNYLTADCGLRTGCQSPDADPKRTRRYLVDEPSSIYARIASSPGSWLAASAAMEGSAGNNGAIQCRRS